MSLKEDQLKNEIDNDIIQESLVKVETIEGLTIYIFTQLQSYPLHQKTSFQFGHLYIYLEVLAYFNYLNQNHAKLECYSSILESIQCLNEDIEWDLRYFEKIKNVLENGGKDYNFSLKIEEETILRINERIQVQGQTNNRKQNMTEVTILKVKLKFSPHLSTLDHLLSQMQLNLRRKQKKLNDSTRTIQKMEHQKKEIMDQVEQMSQQFKVREDELINQFVLLLNEKKKKIKELKAREYQQIEIPIENNNEEEEEQKKQEIVGATQMDMSQPFGSLFNPTLVVKEEPVNKRNKE